MRKSVDDFLLSDWLDAKHNMNENSFKQLVQRAKKAGIDVPAFCQGTNFKPKITFQFANPSETDRFHRSNDTHRINKFNKDVEEWAQEVTRALKANADRLFPRHKGRHIPLSKSIKYKAVYDKKYKAEIYRIGFNFSRHGIYLHYGAGRGVGGLIGSKWTDRYGNLKETNPNSIGGIGGDSKRKAVDWFNPVLKTRINRLADIAADYSADMTVNITKLFIPE